VPIDTLKLHNITLVATKVHVILSSFVVLTRVRDERELVSHVTFCDYDDVYGNYMPILVYFDVKTRDIWEGNMITRSGTQTESICFLRFWGIREGVM